MSDTPDINVPIIVNWSDYDAFLDEAGKDDRIGPQELLVTEATDGIWEKSGDPYREIRGNLTSANNANIDFRLSPPPPPAELAAKKSSMDSDTKKAIARSITMHKQLAQHYGKSPADVRQGDKLKVEIVKTKQGYARVVAFLDKNHTVGTNNTASASDVGF